MEPLIQPGTLPTPGEPRPLNTKHKREKTLWRPASLEVLSLFGITPRETDNGFQLSSAAFSVDISLVQ